MSFTPRQQLLKNKESGLRAIGTRYSKLYDENQGANIDVSGCGDVMYAIYSSVSYILHVQYFEMSGSTVMVFAKFETHISDV